MKVLQVGAKNYPPAHGGTERVVYNIVNSIADVGFHLLVDWLQCFVFSHFAFRGLRN